MQCINLPLSSTKVDGKKRENDCDTLSMHFKKTTLFLIFAQNATKLCDFLRNLYGNNLAWYIRAR